MNYQVKIKTEETGAYSWVKGTNTKKITYFSYHMIFGKAKTMEGIGLLWCPNGKESACNAGDPGLILRLGRLEHSCLENSMHRGAWWAIVHGVTKSGTWLSDYLFSSFLEGIKWWVVARDLQEGKKEEVIV